MPTATPAAFSATVPPVSTGCDGASFTFATRISTSAVRVSLSASVAVIVTVTSAAASRSSEVPSFSFSTVRPSLSTISKRVSSTV